MAVPLAALRAFAKPFAGFVATALAYINGGRFCQFIFKRVEPKMAAIFSFGEQKTILY